MKEMIFWGATGQAKVLRECMRGTSGPALVALFDNRQNIRSPFPDVPVYTGTKGFQEWWAQRADADRLGFLVAVGGDKGRDRVELQVYLESQGLVPLIARHQTAFVAHDAHIGAGSQILAMAAVCVEAQIGRACIVNTSATVDHECILGDGVHICPGAHLAGCVEVGAYATVGTGAVVLPHVKIGEGAMVGAGALVREEVLPYTVVVGNPAKLIRRVRREE